MLSLVLIVVTLGIGYLVWTLILWGEGQTPAKKILKMRVVKASTGQQATWGDMALRQLVGQVLLNIVPFYSLIAALMIFGDGNRCAWDRIAGTVVVDER